MPANVSREFLEAERKYFKAKTDEERLIALEEMIRYMPKHKGAEELRANLRARYKKLKEKIEERKRKLKALAKGKGFGIEKQGIQVCIYGLPNSGKSLLLTLITNAKPKVSEWPRTTIMPEVGILNYNDVEFQIIEFPALYLNLEDDKQWLSYALTTDIILIIALNIDDAIKIIQELFEFNENLKEKPMLVIINSMLSTIKKETIKKEKQMFESKDKRIRKVADVFTCDIKKDYEDLKEALFGTVNIYRIYLKKPTSKQPDQKPIVFLHQPTIADVLEEIKISKEKMIKAIVFGKSVKYSGQSVSLNHKLEDKDIVEFYFKKY